MKRPSTSSILDSRKAPIAVVAALSIACFTPASAFAETPDVVGENMREAAPLEAPAGRAGLQDVESAIPAMSLAEGFGASARSVNDFPDCNPTLWYAEYVTYVSDNGLINGYADTNLFGPYDLVTRGQLAVILWRMAGEPVVSSAGFPDVDEGDFYYQAALWAQSTGVIEGRDVNGVRYFDGEAYVQRQESAKMLASYARYCGADTSTDLSALREIEGWDSPSTQSWALESLGWAADKGLITGYVVDGVPYLMADGYTERCAMAKMITVLDRDVLKNDRPGAETQEEIEQRVLTLLRASLVGTGIEDSTVITIVEPTESWDRSFMAMTFLDFTMAELKLGYNYSTSVHESLEDLATSSDELSGSMYAVSQASGAGLDAIVGIFSSDGEPVYGSMNGVTMLPLSYTLAI